MDKNVRALLCWLNTDASCTASGWLGELSPDDWERVGRLASDYFVPALLHRRLGTSAARSRIPTHVLQDLCKARFLTVAGNMRLASHLSAVLTTLRDQQLSVIVLKGLPFARCVYGDYGVRHTADIDLLARTPDLPRVEEALLASGHIIVGNRAWALSNHFHLGYSTQRGTGSSQVEVHWHLVRPGSPLTIDIDGLWERALPIPQDFRGSSMLCPEDTLLYLCVHASHLHRFDRGLRPLCDVAATLTRYRNEMDFGAVCRRTREWHAEKPVWLTLYLASSLLGAPVPDGLLASLKPDDVPPRLIAAAETSLFSLPSSHGNLVRLLGSSSFREKIALLANRTFPPRRELAWRHGAPDTPLAFLYYGVHLKQLLVRQAKAVPRLLWDRRAMVDMGNTMDDVRALRRWLACPDYGD